MRYGNVSIQMTMTFYNQSEKLIAYEKIDVNALQAAKFIAH
jgi:hypothetical protein